MEVEVLVRLGERGVGPKAVGDPIQLRMEPRWGRMGG